MIAARIVEGGRGVELIGVAIAEQQVARAGIGDGRYAVENIVAGALVIGGAGLRDRRRLLKGRTLGREGGGTDGDVTVHDDRAVVEGGGGCCRNRERTVLNGSFCKGGGGAGDG